jgi:hypothetical protein
MKTGLLTGWEYSFLQDTMRKRKPTERQLSSRVKINEKVLLAVYRRGFHGPD